MTMEGIYVPVAYSRILRRTKDMPHLSRVPRQTEPCINGHLDVGTEVGDGSLLTLPCSALLAECPAYTHPLAPGRSGAWSCQTRRLPRRRPSLR